MTNEPGSTYQAAAAPLCAKCRQMQLPFFDFQCSGCTQMLQDENTTISHIFAIMRQWVPRVQLYIPQLIDEILKRNASIHDRDGLTDMNLLNFACKSGSEGVGDANTSAKTVQKLLELGADPTQCCSLTQMNALHYAVYFDVAPVVRILLQHKSNLDVNSVCPKYDHCTALHMAASNLCLGVTKMLLEFGADPHIRNASGLTAKRTNCTAHGPGYMPLLLVYPGQWAIFPRNLPNEKFPVINPILFAECLPKLSEMPHAKAVIMTLDNLLTDSNADANKKFSYTGDVPSGRALLKSMGLNVGDRILIDGKKLGALRFCGATEFAMGLWAGVELDTPDGKNNGTIEGVTYFTCRPGYGIFVPINKITKLDKSPTFRRRLSVRGISLGKTYPKADFSGVTSKIETGLHPTSPSRKIDKDFPRLGDKIQISRKGLGTLRFAGPTQFATGTWYGIEMDSAVGKNNGTVQGVKYFDCKPNHGIFVTHDIIKRSLRYSDKPGINAKSPLEESTNIHTPSPLQNKFHLLHTGNNQKYTMSLERNSWRSSLRGKPRPSNQSEKINRSVPTSPTSTRRNSSHCLMEGVQVVVNGEMGIVKYVGDVHFAEGTWIGVELRDSHNGKHDGCVYGKRYFTCRPNAGIMVKPHKVSISGVNGATLLPSGDCPSESTQL